MSHRSRTPHDRLSWYAPSSLALQLARVARRRGLTVSAATRVAVLAWLDRDDGDQRHHTDQGREAMR